LSAPAGLGGRNRGLGGGRRGKKKRRRRREEEREERRERGRRRREGRRRGMNKEYRDGTKVLSLIIVL
jgi:hypothetical protein